MQHIVPGGRGATLVRLQRASAGADGIGHSGQPVRAAGPWPAHKPTANNGVITLLNDVSAETALAEPLGDEIPVGSVGDAILTVQALEGDLNQDCKVNVFDDQIIACATRLVRLPAL